MNRFYQIHQFAEFAGVTVKALRHYDRLGLLQPVRTEAGYRMYAERDLERVEQIVALKFLGIPLKRIKAILDQAELALPDALRLQRKAIEEKQAVLCRALQAIQAAERALDSGEDARQAILKKVLKAIDMQDEIAQMKKYYSDAAWELRKRLYEEGPSPEWVALYREVGSMLEEDPGSAKAQDVAARWMALALRAYYGDRSVQTHSGTAWMEREHWPPGMKRMIAEYRLEECQEFINQAALASRKKYFTPTAWEKLVEVRTREQEENPMWWQTLVELYRDIEAAADEDPGGALAQALVKRWHARMDQSSGGHPEVKEGLMKGFADRRNWLPPAQWQAEAVYQMSFERFLKASDFIERAADHS